MRLLVLQLSPANGADAGFLATQLRSHGASSVDTVLVQPMADQVDPVLKSLAGRRLVIATDLAGLNFVLHRLYRIAALDSAETAVVMPAPTRYLRRSGLPADFGGQLHSAVAGRARLVGVIKDDSGGVCIDSARMVAWSDPDAPEMGQWWMRAVVDDQRLADGPVRHLAVRRIGANELQATVQLGRLRSRTRTGRSLQLACDPAQITADGVDRQRPRSNRTFWSEPKLWRLALPD